MHLISASPTNSNNILTSGARLLPILLILLIYALDDVFAEPKLIVNGTLYKCYEAPNCESSARACRNSWKTCQGTTCLKSTHVNTGSVRLRCDNSSEPGQYVVGECVPRTEGVMPDQKEEVCACRGDYCNRAASLTSVGGLLCISLLSAAVILFSSRRAYLL